MEIDALLRMMAAEEASDLHLKPMRPPLLRINGKLKPLAFEPITPNELSALVSRALTEKQRAFLDEHQYLDFGYSVAGVSRFRGALFYQRGTLAAVFRRIPFQFPSLDQWGLPDVIKDFAGIGQGLVLVTGPSGSGKSSTLAGIIREILDRQLVHVVTIEDPIEFLLTDELGTVSQREVGTDTHSYAEALHNALRQDPDVIMVGEMRDSATIATVLTAAETGHLVFSTLHANSSAQTIDRIVDSFHEGQHRQVRQQLSQVLQGIISLQLVDRADGTGMVAAVEVLKRNPRVQKLIGEGKTTELMEEMEKSVVHERMQTIDQSLIALVLNGVITRDAALAASPNPGELTLELRQYQTGNDHHPDGDGMADSTADFSRILELLEIKKLYDEALERHRQEMADKDRYIERLMEQVERQDSSHTDEYAMQALKEEKEKLTQQLAFQRQEFESKIDKLQHRIKELSSPHAETSRGSGGLFRR